MPKVEIVPDGKTFEVEEGSDFLELYENADTALLFGCRSASCGTCLIEVLDGAENLSSMDVDEKDFLETIEGGPNERLACQCKIHGDVKVDIPD